MPTTPRLINLHVKTRNKLISLKREAEQDDEYRVAKRIHAVLLNNENHTSTAIAKLLHAPRSKVSLWLKNYDDYGYESLLEGHRSGRPSQLNEVQEIELGDIIDARPTTYGSSSAIWTSIMIGEVIHEEFGIDFHPGHVRKILKKMDVSVQKPKHVLIPADEEKKAKWRHYIYPNIKKKPAA